MKLAEDGEKSTINFSVFATDVKPKSQQAASCYAWMHHYNFMHVRTCDAIRFGARSGTAQCSACKQITLLGHTVHLTSDSTRTMRAMASTVFPLHAK